MIDVPKQQPTAPDIRVHIDRIVLVGVNPRDRSALRTAVESEMSRLFTERGWPDGPSTSASSEKLDAGGFRHAHTTHDGEVGAQIGGAVYRGITR